MKTNPWLLLSAEPTDTTGGKPPESTPAPTADPAKPAEGDTPPPEKQYDNDRVKLLFGSVEGELDDKPVSEEGEDEEEGEETPPPATPKAGDLPPPPPAPAKPKVTVKKKEPIQQVIKETIIREVPAPAPAPEPKPDAAKLTDEDESYAASLTEEQRYEYEVAKAAEEFDSTKYKGRAKALLKFNRDLDEFAKDGERSEEEIEAFVQKNKPKFTTVEFRKLERELAASEGYKRALKELEGERKELSRKVLKIEKDPEIKAAAQKVITDFVGDLGDDPAAKLYKEKGIEEARKEFPLEAEVYESAAQEAALLTTEYLNMAYGLEPFSRENPTHKAIVDFVDGQCTWFKEHGGEGRVRNGKQFLTRAEYNAEYQKNPQTATSKFWTLSHDEMVACLRQNIASGAKERVKSERARAEKHGFIPKPKGENSELQTPPEPITPPKAKVNPAPGAARGDKAKQKAGDIQPSSLRYAEEEKSA